MTLWRRMFTEEVMDELFLLSVPSTVILNSEYRECEHRTYIVKEHYDWLKSSASLSTIQKHVDGLRGIWGEDHDDGSPI